MEKEDVKKWLAIDFGALGEECITLPGIYQQILEKVSFYTDIYEKAVLERDRLEARFTVEALSDPVKFGKFRLTDITRKAVVMIQPEVKKASDKVLLANAEKTEWEFLLRSADAKKSCLDNLVKLNNQTKNKESK